MFDTLTIEENEALYEILKSGRHHCRRFADFGYKLFVHENSEMGRRTHDELWDVKLELDIISADLTDAYGAALDARRKS